MARRGVGLRSVGGSAGCCVAALLRCCAVVCVVCVVGAHGRGRYHSPSTIFLDEIDALLGQVLPLAMAVHVRLWRSCCHSP